MALLAAAIGGVLGLLWRIVRVAIDVHERGVIHRRREIPFEEIETFRLGTDEVSSGAAYVRVHRDPSLDLVLRSGRTLHFVQDGSTPVEDFDRAVDRLKRARVRRDPAGG